VRHPIEFDPEASLELDQAARWYEDQRSGLGSDFLRASGRTIERLAEQRVLGLRIPTLDRSSLVRRAAVPRFPYQIVFEVIDGVLLVLAVAHDRQRPRHWAGRCSIAKSESAVTTTAALRSAHSKIASSVADKSPWSATCEASYRRHAATP